MNFYAELAQEMKAAGLEGKVVEVPDELKPTPSDFAEINRRTEIRCREVDIMLAESLMYAKNSMPCG